MEDKLNDLLNKIVPKIYFRTPKITVLGPNPAWQRTLTFDEFIPNKINRATNAMECASGKGINFCRAAMTTGERVDICLLQFLGGENGRKVEAELKKKKMRFAVSETAGATRCCTTCLAKGGMTELIDPSATASIREVDKLLKMFAGELDHSMLAAFCGTTPGATSPDFYDRAAELAASHDVPIFLDAYRNIDKQLDNCCGAYLKINRDELAELTGTDDVPAALQELTKKHPRLRAIGITDGPNLAYAIHGDEMAAYEIPNIGEVVNPIGSGDTVSAVWAVGLVTGKDPIKSFALALGAGCANCLSLKPAEFSMAAARDIESRITITFL
ncbi:MAG: PfkB family carbohydrate kinase [Victivallaceae bacterium]|nr:PfkB family carbohydrate kinase [Victivallaceae bacterium]